MTAVELAKIDQLKNALQTVQDALDKYQLSPLLEIRDGAIQIQWIKKHVGEC